MPTFIEPIAALHNDAFDRWVKKDRSSREFIARSVPSITSRDELFARLLEASRTVEFYVWVQRTESGEVIAYAELKKTGKVSDGELELVYVVATEWRNNGIGTSLIRKLVSEDFYGICDIVVAYIGIENYASRKILLRNKFLEVPYRFGGVRYEYKVQSSRLREETKPSADQAGAGTLQDSS